MPSMRHCLRNKPEAQAKLKTRNDNFASEKLPRKRGRPPLRHNIRSSDLPPLPNLEEYNPEVNSPVLASLLTRSLESNPMTASELHEMQEEVENMLTRTASDYRRLLSFYMQLTGKAKSKPSPLVKRHTQSSNGTLAKVSASSSAVKLSNLLPELCQAGPSQRPNADVSPTSNRYYQFTTHSAPDRFWEYVQGYLSAPSNADLVFLDQLIAESDSTSSSRYFFPRIVPKESSCERIPNVQPKIRESNPVNGIGTSRRRQSGHHRCDISCPENANSVLPNNIGEGSLISDSSSPPSSSLKFVVNNSYPSDRRVTRRKSLEEDLGENRENYSALRIELTSELFDDEVAMELIERQAELYLLQAANTSALLHLKQKAEKMGRSEMQKKNLKDVENSLINLAKKLTITHPMFGSMSKRESEQVFKLIRDQQRLKVDFDS